MARRMDCKGRGRGRDKAATSGAAGPPKSRELVITRVFDAPRELVWKAWTDPKHMAQWWGPQGFTNPVCELDVRRGGALRIVMRAPDAAQHPMRGGFPEVLYPDRLALPPPAPDQNIPPTPPA